MNPTTVIELASLYTVHRTNKIKAQIETTPITFNNSSSSTFNLGYVGINGTCGNERFFIIRIIIIII